jgi:amino acid adenylation domain-containing protein/thioester reductase-like protein
MQNQSQINSIHQLVELQVSQTPDAVAVVFEDKQLTYRELNEKANQLAHYLQTLGVKPEVLVGICVDRSLEMIVALLGILKAGGAYVPLDPSYPQERLSFIIEDTQLPVLLTQHHLLETIPTHQAQTICVDNWQAIAQHPADNPDSGVQPNNLAYVIYTSGSTGKPKGVAIEHRNTIAFIDWAREFFTTKQLAGVLASTSLCFDLSIFEIFVTLSCGGKVIVAQNALHLPNLPAANEVTLINTVPSAIAELFRMNGIPTSVYTVNLAGEPLQNALVQQLYQLDHIQQIFNLYGPTEDTTYSTVALMEKGTSELPSIGRPISQTQIYLLDAHLNPVPTGAEGEIYISGAGLARGYLNRPELTAEKFIPNPLSQEPGQERLYKTGDLAAYMPNGELKFFGRIDHQVKIRGFRVELGEIEALLNKSLGIQQAVVVARDDTMGNKRLVAYIVPNSSAKVPLQQVTARILRSLLKQKLPEYMLPSAFVQLDELPLTLNGKVDRRALPVPQWTRMEAGAYVAPRTPVEIQLAEIWNRLLEAEQIGTYDNFCELGGNSLLAIQLLYQVNEAFQIELPLSKFLENPTIAGLAQTIDALWGAETSTTATNNLAVEVELDPTIYPENTLSEPVLELFLTGATGFLGAFLLEELLRQSRSDVYCLVRASSLEEGKARLHNTLKRYQLWNEDFSARIIPILGDMSQPNLGIEAGQFLRLAEKIDIIYHCGAWVNMVYPYSALAASNVIATQEVLRLASQTKIKPLHFISTVDVFSTANGAGIRVVGERDTTGPLPSLYNGYAQSKYIAEKLVMTAYSRGLPVSIYRPSNIMGHSQTGICQNNGFVARMLKGCIQMGIAPELEALLNLVPVDFVSRAIYHLSRQQKPCGEAFQIVNPVSMEWRQLVNWISSQGYPLQVVAYETWYAQLLKQGSNRTLENALAPLMTLFVNQKFIQQSLGSFYFEFGNTLDRLAINSIVCPPVNDELLNSYFSYFTKSGFLNPPCSSSELRGLMLQQTR